MRAVLRISAALTIFAGCDHPPPCVEENEPPAPLVVTVRAVDEAGAPLDGASIAAGDQAIATNAQGEAVIEVQSPTVLLVGAKGRITEPVPIGWSDADEKVDVRLLSDAGGARVVIHSGGDVMLGRRYESPASGEPLIRASSAAKDATRVLAALRPAFSAADVRTVNLETVLGDLPAEARYPGKRFILQSRPQTIQAIKGLGVDVASLANNHARDYLDVGIAGTKGTLAAAGLPIVGASESSEDADQPAIVEVRGTKVGVIAYTTVNGSVVNDQYPIEKDTVPEDLPEKEAWLYERRSWGFSAGKIQVPATSRRIGTAWQIFQGLEPEIEEAEIPPFWSSLAKVYPETQDWVSRRGHGGAALWREKESLARIAELAAKVDVVVVQIHAGFQFQEASSEVVHEIAHQAIDAGAHLVVCHHPHVLQGLEYYKGRLVAFSLGNFVFDQDFLSTFGSMFLRTVWEKGSLVEARIVPVELDAYRPVPVTGEAASRTVLRLWERSVLPIQTRRDDDLAVRAHEAAPQADTRPAQLVLEHHTARVVEEAPTAAEVAIDLAPGEVKRIGFEGLIDARLGLEEGAASGVRVGRDLFGWGRFEDETADDRDGGDTHWALDSCQQRAVVGDAATGRGFLRLRRDKRASVLTRPVARIPLAIHRAYAKGANEALDPAPSYTLRAMARLEGDAQANARFDVYHFDDTDPTEDPESTLIRSVEARLPVEQGGDWQSVEVALPEAALAGGLTANMVLVYLSLDPPRATGEATLDVDDLAFVEWRDAESMPAWLAAFDLVRDAGDAPVSLRFSGLPVRR